MTRYLTLNLIAFFVAGSISSYPVWAQNPGVVTPAAVSAKLISRGDAPEVVIPEMRVVRRNDILTVQSELHNKATADRMVFYRYRWLDGVGNQIGDGESWKQIMLMGQGQQTIKGVAHHSNATDFRLELSFEKK
ncbi:YcfL family protein [Limnohabitans sp.]|uniref:YcfL family protein n=1 Tax=Limnohabitans sp. TaxID=1907725 RepID=UPI002AFE6332|nr:YcfL family protein [Limnohabitans sp.]